MGKINFMRIFDDKFSETEERELEQIFSGTGEPLDTSQTFTLKPCILHDLRFNKNGYIIGLFRNLKTNKIFSAKGNMVNPSQGIEYSLTGKWELNARFGDTFKFKDYSSEAPKNLEAIRTYLRSNVPGIGYSYAEEVVNIWKGDSLNKIKSSSPEEIHQAMGGRVPLATCRNLKQSIVSLQDKEDSALKINIIFQGVRIPGKTKAKILEDFGADLFDKIKENPYQLTKYRGISFLTADKIAVNLEVPHTSPFRIREGILFGLEEIASQGHTRVSAKKFIYGAAGKTLTVDRELVTNVMQDMIEKEDSIIYNEVDDTVALLKYYNAEKFIADTVRNILATPDTDDLTISLLQEETLPDIDLSDLAEDQKRALLTAISHKVFILTGAPGTGKTYLIKKLLFLYHNILKYGLGDIALAAPTGKAAKRMFEQTTWVSSTIHRLLEPELEPVEKKFIFTRNEGNPLSEKLIILDEASMIDIPLMCSFLKAVKPESRLIIIGDHYQLPSVGPGNVLRDLIAGGIPSVELTEIKRQNPGSIVTNCHRIKNGETVIIKPGQQEDLWGIYHQKQEAIQEELLNLLKETLPDKFREVGEDIDPIWDIQIISPYNSMTSLSCEPLNELLQKELNPGDPLIKTIFKVGDKVIQTKNDYTLGVINGDIGRVIGEKTDTAPSGRVSRALEVKFFNPERDVIIDIMENDLKLAYCITCHKFQGSEEKIVILPMYKGFSPKIMQRNWLYTAISRAAELCVIVGELNMVDGIVKRTESMNRVNNLIGFLKT